MDLVRCSGPLGVGLLTPGRRGVIQFSADIALYGISTFLCVKDLSQTAVTDDLAAGPSSSAAWASQRTTPSCSRFQVRLLQPRAPLELTVAVVVYVLGLVSFLIQGRLSDRYRKRGVFIFGGFLCQLVGYIILGVAKPTAARYTACFVVALGLYIPTGTNIAWARHHSHEHALGADSMVTGPIKLDAALQTSDGRWAHAARRKVRRRRAVWNLHSCVYDQLRRCRHRLHFCHARRSVLLHR